MKKIAKIVFEEFSEKCIDLRATLPLRFVDLFPHEQDIFIEIVGLTVNEYLKQEKMKGE